MKSSAGLHGKIRALCEPDMKSGPWSVTNHRPDGLQLATNDYHSEGPDWWPDPKNPKGRGSGGMANGILIGLRKIGGIW